MDTILAPLMAQLTNADVLGLAQQSAYRCGLPGLARVLSLPPAERAEIRRWVGFYEGEPNDLFVGRRCLVNLTDSRRCCYPGCDGLDDTLTCAGVLGCASPSDMLLLLVAAECRRAQRAVVVLYAPGSSVSYEPRCIEHQLDGIALDIVERVRDDARTIRNARLPETWEQSQERQRMRQDWPL